MQYNCMCVCFCVLNVAFLYFRQIVVSFESTDLLLHSSFPLIKKNIDLIVLQEGLASISSYFHIVASTLCKESKLFQNVSINFCKTCN